jgi:hypothetical protein
MPEQGIEYFTVPATDIKARVPAYSPNHDLHIIASAMATRPTLGPYEYDAWNIFASNSTPRIDRDVQSSNWRIYYNVDIDRLWWLVAYPPSKSPNVGPPPDWFIGACQAHFFDSSYSCVQNAWSDSVLFTYSLEQEDLHVKEQVQEAIVEMSREWARECHES